MCARMHAAFDLWLLKASAHQRARNKCCRMMQRSRSAKRLCVFAAWQIHCLLRRRQRERAARTRCRSTLWTARKGFRTWQGWAGDSRRMKRQVAAASISWMRRGTLQCLHGWHMYVRRRKHLERTAARIASAPRRSIQNIDPKLVVFRAWYTRVQESRHAQRAVQRVRRRWSVRIRAATLLSALTAWQHWVKSRTVTRMAVLDWKLQRLRLLLILWRDRAHERMRARGKCGLVITRMCQRELGVRWTRWCEQVCSAKRRACVLRRLRHRLDFIKAVSLLGEWLVPGGMRMVYIQY